MLKSRLSKLWNHAWSMVLTKIGSEEIGWLFGTGGHPVRLTSQRAGMIVSRVRLVAGLFAMLTPLWIFADMLVFPPEVWHVLLPMRLLAAVAFAGILLAVRRMHTLRDAYFSLFYLLAVATAFYLFIRLQLSGLDLGGHPTGFAAGYAYLPFVMVAVQSVLPLTVVENLVLASPMLIAHALGMFPVAPANDWIAFLTSSAALLLGLAVSVMAGLSQLAFMIVMVREGIHDSLTGCYSRRYGEELLDLHFAWSIRGNNRLAVARIALDDFHDLNVLSGYAAGDAALRNATEALNDSIRSGDTLARWGGTQYLLILPLATAEHTAAALQRPVSSGLGRRPDGTTLTASIGIAERMRDAAEDWWQMVDLAEKRMQAASQAGGNRIVDR